jgi:hypothetical protein
MRKVIIVLIDQSINTQTNAIHKHSPTKAEECGLFENEEGGGQTWQRMEHSLQCWVLGLTRSAVGN